MTERDLLLACMRSDHPPSVAFSRKKMLGLCNQHSVLPTMQSRLGSAAGPEITAARQRQALRCLALTAELVRITESLGSLGIEIMPFKGPVLAALLYRDVTRRQYQDLDLLVDAADLPRIVGRLEEDGYPAVYPGTSLRTFLRFQHVYDMARSHPRARIELHWELNPRRHGPAFDFAALRQRAMEVTVGGKTFLTLSIPDLILYLCIHGSRHRWSRLAWIQDLATLLSQQTQLDWKAMLETSRRLGCERRLCLGVQLAARLLGAPLPDLNSPEVAVAGQLAAQVESALRSGHEVENRLFDLALLERAADKAHTMLNTLLEPTVADITYVRLPESLSWGYYLVRPLRLLLGRLGLVELDRRSSSVNAR